MAFPLSVLNSKKIKYININNVENSEDTFVTKNIDEDFKTQLNKVFEAGLYYEQKMVEFLYHHKLYFYHNNVATLLLSLIIMHKKLEGETSYNLFLSSKEYSKYIMYISRSETTNDEQFMIKLFVEINAYIEKISYIQRTTI